MAAASSPAGFGMPAAGDRRTRRLFAVVGGIVALSAVCCLLFVVSTEQQQQQPNELVSLAPYDPLTAQSNYWSNYWAQNPYKQLQHYQNALETARQSNEQMANIIAHYHATMQPPVACGSNPSCAYGHYYGGYSAVSDAADAWAARKKVLNRLHYEIVKSQNRLHSLHAEEEGLLDRHRHLRSTVSKLLHTSTATAHEIEDLRDRYAEKIQKLEGEYKDAKEERDEAALAHDREAGYGYKRTREARANVAKAIATANYYAGQVRAAKENVYTFRDRAERAESKAGMHRRAMEAELNAALDQRTKEKEAEAAREIAQKKAIKVDDIMRSKSKASEELALAKAQLMEETTEAKVSTGIADAAKEAVEDTEREEERYKEHLGDLKYDLTQETDGIIDQKNKADNAEAKAKLYEERTEDAKSQLEEAIAAKEDAVAKAQEAVKMVEEAEAKAALAKTQAKITEMSTKKANVAAKLEIAQAQKKVAESNAELEEAEDKTKRLEDRKFVAVQDAQKSVASVTDAENELTLAEERKELMAMRAEEALQEAEEKKAKAEELLKTVDSLAAMAREAAQVAAAEKAKAEGAAAAASGGCAAAGCEPVALPAMAGASALAEAGGEEGGKAQAIDIHVIPHAPVMGPGGEEGLAFVGGDDKGTRKLRDSGINV